MSRDNTFITDAERREVRQGAWYFFKWFLAVLVISSVLSGILWGFGVIGSPLKGAGEAFKTKQSATNRIAAQERFEERYADIEVAGSRIDTLLAAAKANDTYESRTAATGAITYCLDLVSDYNADARKYTAEAFRAEDLPNRVDPVTTCRQEG